MFEPETYSERRAWLRERVGDGIVLLPGNRASPMNFAANLYPFRQDASFLYFFGLDRPDLAGTVDLDDGGATLYGDDAALEETVWTGPASSVADEAARAGVARTRPRGRLVDDLRQAVERGRAVHFLPQYRADNAILLEEALGIPAARASEHASATLRNAVIALRAVKTTAEIEQLDRAATLSARVHVAAMHRTRPGALEREVVATIEALATAQGAPLAYPVICSRHGEILHNDSRDGRLEADDLVLCDAGVESPLHYAGDVTRTWPGDGRFTQRQREVYEMVLQVQQAAITAVRPGVPFRELHLQAARGLATGLRDLGLMRGDVDEAVAAGAHALFFPHGLGHMLGLDVHDLEALGEDHVGYDAEFERSSRFGLSNLRLARRLEPGFALTIEPGLYFIPGLIDRWREERRHEAFIDYAAVERYRDFGGIRIEDDVVVLDTGHRVLGEPLVKEVDDLEATVRAHA